MPSLIVIGGGLAGSEAAWQAAQRGIKVKLYEMRPRQTTGAHTTDRLAELVCSNSLGTNLTDRPSGVLKEELRLLGSLLLELAEASAVPAGGSLAVDRQAFAEAVTQRICAHPNIQLIREEYPSVPNAPAIIASGPLTSNSLSQSIRDLTGQTSLYFFDAIAPIVSADSVDMNIAFRQSRYCKGETNDSDYINCPLNHEQYNRFVEALQQAERIQLRDFEAGIQEGVTAGSEQYFEGCLPVEVIANREKDALAYGPMRPVGLRNPLTGGRPFAVIQLRQDNLAATLYNLVGFQTNLTFPEQKRVFRMVPGLEKAEFVRYGQMHRNTFIASPVLLKPTLQLCEYPDLFFAGQITGVEGYLGNIGTGLLAGINAARFLNGQRPIELPGSTMLGALCHYITHASLEDFQPMKANFGLLPDLSQSILSRHDRQIAYSIFALENMQKTVQQLHLLDLEVS
jgi:methylenetetrahydrofolate--tRNA-(uracil-5-)-methyltransferase